MSDYSMIGSFSEGGASALNGDIITNLREAEEKAVISPLDKSLETWDTELEKIGEIEVKVNELLSSAKLFDLFSSSNNAFEQITATTSGSSAVFDALDVGGLNEGSFSVDIQQLAKKDVHQTALTFTDKTASAAALGNASDILKITVGSTYDSANTVEIDTNQSFEDMVAEINLMVGVSASIEEIADAEYRIVIRSTKEGTENNIFLGEDQSNATGTDTTAEESAVGFSDMLKSQNLLAVADGVSYDVSENSITIDGNLRITATSEGVSNITIQRDDSFILPALEELALQYNELLEMIEEEIYSEESSIEDPSSLRSMMDGIKNILFSTHGDDENSLFNYGFSFDLNGKLTIDATVLGEALTNNFDDVKGLFIGSAEDKGIGTQLTEYMNDLSAYNGLLTMYGDNMTERKTTLEEEKEKSIETLDAKYGLMATQFIEYGAIIAQMEASFSGLKQMMADASSD